MPKNVPTRLGVKVFGLLDGVAEGPLAIGALVAIVLIVAAVVVMQRSPL
ncbi:MAG TPA: hypothetical protein VJ801_05755 [Polyangia bacterium]|jgi:hypothetical protein|nr:hypothetical protein [Polyangia bacterium]